MKKSVMAISLAALGLLWWRSKPAKTEPPDEVKSKAGLTMMIIDAAGNEVPVNSPAKLVPGQNYIVYVVVTNQSTKLAVLVAAKLTLTVDAVIADIFVIPTSTRSDDYSAGQIQQFNFPMSIAMNLADYAGDIVAQVKSPAGVVLATGKLDLSVQAVPTISYAATVEITLEE